MISATETIDELGRRARKAARSLTGVTSRQKSDALDAMAEAAAGNLTGHPRRKRNRYGRGKAQGISEALMDRLLLSPARIEAIASGLRKVAALPDPVGLQTAGWTMYNGVRVQRVRVPLGVVAVIYEARPNVTADASGLCVKSGNAALLRGSSYSLRSNLAVAAALRTGLEKAGLPADAVQVVSDTSREAARALMTARRWVDLLVPRGGPGLIAAVEEHATVPVVIDGAGNCHVYVDRAADLAKAEAIIINAKCQRPGRLQCCREVGRPSRGGRCVCALAVVALRVHGVEVRGDDAARAIVPDITPATAGDWDTEYPRSDHRRRRRRRHRGCHRPHRRPRHGSYGGDRDRGLFGGAAFCCRGGCCRNDGQRLDEVHRW